MSQQCTRCMGLGFLNLDQIPDQEWAILAPTAQIIEWIKNHDGHDVSVCDCCGNGEDAWYGEPGEHYNRDDPPGHTGPYTYNGGLCECHHVLGVWCGWCGEKIKKKRFWTDDKTKCFCSSRCLKAGIAAPKEQH